MSLHCAHCGFHNPPGMRFCGNCGTRLAEGDGPLAPAPAVSPAISEQLGELVGANLLERFRRAGLEAAGQRRNVTVLFADLVGFTEIAHKLDSEDVYELVQEFVRLLANEVYKYEGIVDKLTGDGLMAIFGAPITHENNAERAVRAALEMQAGLQELSRQVKERLGIPLRMRIGLNAGAVIVGGVGSNFMMDYTAIGDTVNLANRLEQAASPGSILASERVFRLTRALVDFQPVAGLNLKGIDSPVTGYRVAGLKARPGPVRGLEGLRAPMVGRDEELNRLKGAAQALASRRSGIFALVVGEGGIGKSRLVSEFKAFVEPAPIRVLEGHSLTYRRSVSYWIFLDLLRNYLEVSPSLPEAEVTRRLAQKAFAVLGPRAAELLPYLEHLLSLPPSDPAATGRIAYLDAGQLRQQIFLAVRDLLAAEARRRPLLLVLEDLHWADEASLDLLQFLLEASHQVPLMILGITRPFGEGTLARIAGWSTKYLGERFFTLQLHNLSHGQSEHLLSELLSIPEFPAELRRQILDRAAGIPFYLEEILRMLIDQGFLERTGESWRLVTGANPAELGVPDTLQGLILARFDRLGPAARATLQAAAVIGHHFDLPLLGALLAQSPQPEASLATVRDTLAGLVERDFILPASEAAGNETYRFRHVLMSEAIYSTLLRRERSRLHGQVGQAIEELFAGRLEEHIELLARHYSWSPRSDRALHYLILAGRKAARRYANRQAQQHFEAALALLPQVDPRPEQALQVHIGLGDGFALAGEYQAAREHYRAAEGAALSGSPEDILKNHSALLRKIATTYERQGEYEEALQRLGQAQEMLLSASESLPVEKTQVLSEIGWVHFRRGSLEAAEECLIQALSLVENGVQYDLIASIYNRLGGIYFQKDQLDQASHWVRKSLVLREEIGDTVAVARSYNNLGLLGWKRGDWEGALANFNRSAELHANLGDVEGMVNVQANLGLLHLDRGAIAEARQHLDSALATALGSGNAYHIGVIYLHLARLAVAIADWGQALDYGKRSLAILDEIGAQDPLADLYTSLGQAWLGLGDLDQAQEWGERALALFAPAAGGGPPDPSQERGRALRLLAEAARLRGRLDRSEDYLKECEAIFAAQGDSLELGRCNLSKAALAAARGDPTRARLLLSETRLIFRQLGAQLDLRQLEDLAALSFPV